MNYWLLFVFVVTVNGDLAGNVGDFFTKQFTDVKSLFANDEKDLQNNAVRVKDLLDTIQGKSGLLKPLANDAQKSTLEKIGDMMSQVTNFQKIISNANIDFSKKKSDWEELVKNIFVTEGLNKIIPLLQKVQNGTPTVCATVLISVLVPIIAFLKQ